MKRACAARVERKAWGVSPRTARGKHERAREAGGRFNWLSPASRALWCMDLLLGLTPKALRLRVLRTLNC
jgi:hypothetical protein